MCFGTDLLGPLTAEQSREFGIRARVLSAADVLRSATVNAAAMLRQEGFLGQVKPGFAADLLVLAGGGIHGHPDGSAAGVTSMREAWESAARGESPAGALESSAALRRATETFGPVRV